MADSPALDQVRKLFTELHPEGDAEPTIDDMRAGYETILGHADVPADAVVEHVDANGVPALLVGAPQASAARTVVWFHSGGYILGSANGYRALGYAISAAAAAQVLVVDYRLAPEHPFPAQLDDAVAASRWAFERSGAASTVIAGDSAGGGLTVATLVRLRESGGPLPAAAVTVSGLFDLTASGDSMDTVTDDPVANRDSITLIAQAYLQGAVEPTDPSASPLFADLAGLPPLLAMVGTSDVLLDDTRRLAERYGAAGGDVTLVVAEGMVHIWPLFHSILPEGQEGVDTIGRFVEERTS